MGLGAADSTIGRVEREKSLTIPMGPRRLLPICLSSSISGMGPVVFKKSRSEASEQRHQYLMTECV